MPGFELFGEEERAAVNEIFDKAVQDFFGLQPPQREPGLPKF